MVFCVWKTHRSNPRTPAPARREVSTHSLRICRKNILSMSKNPIIISERVTVLRKPPVAIPGTGDPSVTHKRFPDDKSRPAPRLSRSMT